MAGFDSLERNSVITGNEWCVPGLLFSPWPVSVRVFVCVRVPGRENSVVNSIRPEHVRH